MKRKIIYLLMLACFLGLYSSAKQVYKSSSSQYCYVCKQAAKKKAAEKNKRIKVATIRPFNFYLFNI